MFLIKSFNEPKVKDSEKKIHMTIPRRMYKIAPTWPDTPILNEEDITYVKFVRPPPEGKKV